MSREDTIRLTVKSLLEVVQTGAKNIEVAVLAPGERMQMLSVEEIEKYVESINTEKAEEAATRRPGRTPGTGSLPTRSAEAAEGEPAADE
jgi:20S proteasome subunit alpha 4